MNPQSKNLAHHEIVTIAVYLLRGDIQAVDSEDVAIKADEIAPGRFSWRKYPEQVNLDAVRKRLWDACRPDKGGYLIGSYSEGWRLTKSGIRFASENVDRLDVMDERRPLSVRERRWRNREQERMLASDAYLQFTRGGKSQLRTLDAEKFFRIDEHVSQEQRQARAERALVFFGDDEELGELVQVLAQIVLEGLSND